MLCILIVALLTGWLYMRHLASRGELDPEIVKVIEDPVGTAREYVDAFNQNSGTVYHEHVFTYHTFYGSAEIKKALMRIWR